MRGVQRSIQPPQRTRNHLSAYLTKLSEVENMELAHGGCPAVGRHVVGVELDVRDGYALDERAIQLQLP